jgi:hypothetical protein
VRTRPTEIAKEKISAQTGTSRTSRPAGCCFSKSARILRKDLDDIPYYWPQARQLGLPAIQYTARDVRSGLLFWSFAEKRSAAASAVFAARIQQHLDRYGVSLRDLVWQTDNGGEFKGPFPTALGGSQHVCTPPAAYTYQSDVETAHRLEEDEFFNPENFANRGDFLAKVHTYQLYFNLAP